MSERTSPRAFFSRTGEVQMSAEACTPRRLRTAHRFRVSSPASDLALIAFLSLPLMAAMAWLVGL